LIRLPRSSVVGSNAVHLVVLGLVTGWPLLLSAQVAKPAAAPAPAITAGAPTVAESWDSLLQGAIPQATPDPALIPPQAPVRTSAAGDFLNHFFLEDRTDYFRYDASFTGLPTNTGVINAPFTGTRGISAKQ
jgi:hypothetical protein